MFNYPTMQWRRGATFLITSNSKEKKRSDVFNYQQFNGGEEEVAVLNPRLRLATRDSYIPQLMEPRSDVFNYQLKYPDFMYSCKGGRRGFALVPSTTSARTALREPSHSITVNA